MRVILIILFVSSCSPVAVTAIAYTESCPEGDSRCEMRKNAQTLEYLGHGEAATSLMCRLEGSVKESLGFLCSLY